MQRKNVLNSPRLEELKKSRRQIFINKILLFLLGVATILATLVFLSRLQKVNISEIEVEGNKVVDVETIKELVTQQISGNYLWLFPKSNIFFYSKSNIKNKIFDSIKRVSSIELSVKNNKVLVVSITERIPKYTWCGDILDLVAQLPNNEKCHFMDENGFIFDEAPYFSGEVYFKFYGKTSGEVYTPIGSYFLKDNFSKIVSFRDSLEKMDLEPTMCYVGENMDVKIYLSNKNFASSGPEIIFKADADFQKLLENLEAALTTEPLKTNFKNKYSSLLYIDLRFGNKVYFKFR